MGEWVSIDERLPTRSDYYLACWIYGGSVVSGEVWYEERGELSYWIHPHYGGDEKEYPPEPPVIRYWMSIPLPPIELAKELSGVE